MKLSFAFSLLLTLCSMQSSFAKDSSERILTIQHNQLKEIKTELRDSGMPVRLPCPFSKADGLDCVVWIGSKYGVNLTLENAAGEISIVKLKNEGHKGAKNRAAAMSETLKEAQRRQKAMSLDTKKRTLTLVD